MKLLALAAAALLVGSCGLNGYGRGKTSSIEGCGFFGCERKVTTTGCKAWCARVGIDDQDCVDYHENETGKCVNDLGKTERTW